MGNTNLEEGPERRILREALRLGFEVGFRGHIEGVGWVRSKYRELECEAENLHLEEELQEKFEMGKEFGKRKRLTSFTGNEGGLFFPKASKPEKPRYIQPKPIPVRRVDRESSTDLIIERVPAKEGIDAIATLLKLANKNDKLRKRLDTMFSSMADIQDRLGELSPVGGDKAQLFNAGIGALQEFGWLEEVEILEVDLVARTAKLDAVSMIAKSIGSSKEPMCKPVCVVLESIGNKTFSIETLVIEKRCMCQGEEKCRFVFLPRPKLL